MRPRPPHLDLSSSVLLRTECPSLTRDAASTAPDDAWRCWVRMKCPSLTRDAASTAHDSRVSGVNIVGVRRSPEMRPRPLVPTELLEWDTNECPSLTRDAASTAAPAASRRALETSVRRSPEMRPRPRRQIVHGLRV